MNHKLVTLENLKKFKEKIYNYIDRTVTPIGTIIPYLGLVPPPGYLICNGDNFDRNKYPELYKFLGSDLLPDLGEISFVGNGRNYTYPIQDHYEECTSVNFFSDDQIQNLTGNFTAQVGSEGSNIDRADGVFYRNGDASYLDSNTSNNPYPNGVGFDASRVARTGTTTHGKMLGVNYIINATAKCPDSQWIVDVTTTDSRYRKVGDFFISNVVTTNVNWKKSLREGYDYLSVKITYADGNHKNVDFFARLLSYDELETISEPERKSNNKWYWTSSHSTSSNFAWYVDTNGSLQSRDDNFSDANGGICVGCRINGL